MKFNSIDIFCQVIDNFGDAGVVYRFAKEFQAAHPNCRIRLYIDNLEVLKSVHRSISTDCFFQMIGQIGYVDSSKLTSENVNELGVAEIIVEAFACQIPECYMRKALFNSSLIINLEYLSAENWVEGYHLKESLLPEGTVKKVFFMPGFNTHTGGVILNSCLLDKKQEITTNRIKILQDILLKNEFDIFTSEEILFGTIFTYERGLDNLLYCLQKLNRSVLLMIFGQKSHLSMQKALERASAIKIGNSIWEKANLRIVFMPFISQAEYDKLLCCTDFNLVRGEDSLVRGILSAKPFVWNAYLQDDKYQKVKVDALLNAMHPYFDDEDVFSHYKELLLKFNDAAIEQPIQNTNEDFTFFFQNLNKFEHAVSKMCYFIEQNCNLVQNFSDFIGEFQNS